MIRKRVQQEDLERRHCPFSACFISEPMLSAIERAASNAYPLGADFCTKGHRSATQNTFDACVKLARVERLRYVVVGSDLESDDAIDHGSRGRQHDDRGIDICFGEVSPKRQGVPPL